MTTPAKLIRFQGAVLHPFDQTRLSAALAIGVRFLRVSPEETRAAGESNPPARWIFEDVIITVWLCALPDAKVAKIAHKPRKALARALEWAQEHGVSAGNPAAVELADCFTALVEVAGKNVVAGKIS
jgi:hypothetical protein